MKMIFIYGPMGSGKSRVGRKLAENINAQYFDLEQKIEAAEGRSIPEIISNLGMEKFIEIEANNLFELIGEHSNINGNTKTIISLGSGTLLKDENKLKCEEAGIIICLDPSELVLGRNLNSDFFKTPLLTEDMDIRLKSLQDFRGNHYKTFKLRIANDPSMNIDQISAEIQNLIGYFWISGMTNGYDVIIQKGIIRSVGNVIEENQLNGAVFIVCDENVEGFYAHQLAQTIAKSGHSVYSHAIKAGEDSKNLEIVSEIWNKLLVAGIDRKSAILALGGGVVSDVTGFVSATFMRGCSWIIIPTSLLSMIDASIGGKTGFDFKNGKNLIGTFYSPRVVLIDPELLATLPAEEFRSGMAEVVKHGIIGDPELFDICSKGLDYVKNNLTDVITRAIAVKVKIIKEDPYEKEFRASLNFGHTIGHAVESASKYKIRHGEAVSIGMVAETLLSEKLGLVKKEGNKLSSQIRLTLSNLGLPTEIPKELSRQEIISIMALDKKKEQNIVKFSLPIDIGLIKVGVPVEDLEGVL